MFRFVSFFKLGGGGGGGEGLFDTIHNCYYYVHQIMYVDKDFELTKNQISQHLAWLSIFLTIYLHLNTKVRVIFPNNGFLLSKFHSFTHVTQCYFMLPHVTTCYCTCYRACYCGNITFC